MKNILIAFFVAITSCKDTSSIGHFEINADLKNYSLKKIYVADAYEWEELIDSAESETSAFKFKLLDNKLKGRLVSLLYKDKANKFRKFEFVNHVRSLDSTKYFLDAFLLDSSAIAIEGDSAKYSYLTIKAGSENDAFFRTQMTDFGYLEHDVEKRTQQLQLHNDIIREYPNSTYLLKQLYKNRATIKKKELEVLLRAFGESSLKEGVGKQLLTYNLGTSNNPFLKSMVLHDQARTPSLPVDSNSRLNMIVVWASWCGPCRNEIPDLKKLQEKFAKNGLKITSISIDESVEKWEQALKKENMMWKQLIVPIESRSEFDAKFEISSIPDVIFTDSSGKILDRFVGYKQGQIKDYELLINRMLDHP